MKILLIHFNYFPPRTGGEYTYLKIYEALKERYDVTNISTSSLTVRLHGINFFMTKHSMEFLSILFPLCVRNFYDLIFTSWSCEMPFFGDIAYIQPPAGSLTMPKGCRFSVGYNPHLRGRVANALGVGATWPWRRFFGWFSLKNHTFISNSLATKRYIKYQLGKDSAVIYPPVPTHQYNLEYSRKENLVVSIGGVDQSKRFDLIGVVGPQVPQAKFVLIGYADSRGQRIIQRVRAEFKKAGLENNFIYLGKASESLKREVLLKAKVLFHPAPYEPFGIAIVEGMAAGAIPIAHNSGGPPEFVEPEYLFTDATEAAEKIKDALGKNLSVRKGMKLMASKFSEERFKKEILDAVSDLL